MGNISDEGEGFLYQEPSSLTLYHLNEEISSSVELCANDNKTIKVHFVRLEHSSAHFLFNPLTS